MALTRRTFLLGGVSAAVLAGCGGDDDDVSSAPRSTTTTTARGSGLAIARVFAPKQPLGGELRLPIALADAEGAILDTAPATVSYRYGIEGSSERSDPVEVARHDEGIPTPYFPLLITFPETGSWQIDVEAGDERAATKVEVVPPNETAVVPARGEPLLALQTPTVENGAGVDPICTRDPVCPFHDQTLEGAMATGKAVAFLISTPQFCQTAICGPVLDLLIDRQAQYAETVAFVHAEVYTDTTAKTTTPAVQAYGLTWEPALFLATPDGTIASRLDYTYDAVELDRALSLLVQ
jgi:hypothetical protein